MSQSLVLDVKGEHTYSSEISGVPQGSLSLALNVNINRLNVIEPRRGFDILDSGSLPSSSDRPKKLFFWNSTLYCHYGTTFGRYPGAGFIFVAEGSLTTPSNATSVRAVSFPNKNFYVTSDAGLKKTDAVGTSLYKAGIPKGLTIDLADGGAGTAVAVNNNYIGFRYLLGRKDASGSTQFGGVSGKYVYQNLSGTNRNITVTCYIPTGLDTTYFIQLYKSVEGTSYDVGDELQLCYEAPISSTNVSNGYVTITDIVPCTDADALLGATIYTAPGQQGLVNDNAQPPLARDICEYKTALFFADIESKQRLILSLISVGSPGFVATDTITIVLGGTTEEYIGHATTFNSSIKQFVVTTSGSAAQNIDATIKSFLKCVNLASAIVYGFSLSDAATSLPGKILIEARSLGTATFAVKSSRDTAFQPQLPTTATVNNTSSADASPNGLAYSKPLQPEAVPIKNVIPVGSADDRIKRIVALRDGLFIFKERDGVYVLRGENEASYTVSLLDNTAKLVAPDSLVTVNNQIYGLFEAGICEVSDTGVSIISLPIKDQLQPLYAAPLSALKAYSFGISADSEGKYILSIPESSSATTTTKQIIFDVFGRTFARWDLNLKCGIVSPVDAKMYLGMGTSHKIRQELKTFDYSDFGDLGDPCTIASYSTTRLTINNTDDMNPGDILYQSTTAIAYIEAVNAVSGYVDIDAEQTWTTGVATVVHVKAINVKVQWNADFAGNAAGLKQYYEAALIFKQGFQKECSVHYSTDVNPAEQSITLISASYNGEFGQSAFGDDIFGGEQAKAPRRLGIPRGHAICNQLTARFQHRVAYSDFQLTGISYSFNPVSTSNSR